MKIPTTKIIVMRITVIIALVELVIMITFANIPFDIGVYTAIFLDVGILVMLSTPLIYILIIKPYVVEHDDAIRQVSHMAYHDPLTQLANRRLLTEYLDKLISSYLRDEAYGALLYIDLDGFKDINDKNGHAAGDVILVEVSKRLRNFVRTEDIVSRVGGDEFVVVLSHLDTDEQIANRKALLVAEKILKGLNKAIDYKNTSLFISSSIGLRLLSPERINAESALKDADTAMYRAKQAGKNHIVAYNK